MLASDILCEWADPQCRPPFPASDSGKLSTHYYQRGLFAQRPGAARRRSAKHGGGMLGGHQLTKTSTWYARRVGNLLGLRELNICTGCGPGAMEAP